jgi:cytoskeleton protein RodZ
MSASQPNSSVAQAAAPATLQPADPVVAPEPANVPLMVRTRGESWVQVRDAAGRVVFEKKMVQGDSAPVSGVLPFSVVVGRADVTDVYVRGKLFELNSVSRENVARFEVKQ